MRSRTTTTAIHGRAASRGPLTNTGHRPGSTRATPMASVRTQATYFRAAWSEATRPSSQATAPRCPGLPEPIDLNPPGHVGRVPAELLNDRGDRREGFETPEGDQPARCWFTGGILGRWDWSRIGPCGFARHDSWMTPGRSCARLARACCGRSGWGHAPPARCSSWSRRCWPGPAGCMCCVALVGSRSGRGSEIRCRFFS